MEVSGQLHAPAALPLGMSPPLQIPLVNVMSVMDELRIANVKAEVKQMIKDQESKHDQNLYTIATSWGTTLIICVIFLCI
jgi:hypothetical protein